MREGFRRIALQYRAAKSEQFKEHDLANFIRREMPRRLAEALGSRSLDYRIRGSAGQSKWVDSPWIAVMDPIVTDSAMEGYYPVYLFNENFDRIALILGQGTDALRQEFGTARAAALLRARADIIRQKVPEFATWFQPGPFGVASREKAGDEWDISSTFGSVYEIESMPANEMLAADLGKMLDLYRLLVMRGGFTTEEGDEDAREETSQHKTEWKEGEAQLKVHKRLERKRNSSLVKEVKRKQGYRCRGCGFDFQAVYGTAGEKYIDAHHLVPLAALKESGPVARNPEKDFAVLCANCHRMIHKMGCPSLDDFKREIRCGYSEALHLFLQKL